MLVCLTIDYAPVEGAKMVSVLDEGQLQLLWSDEETFLLKSDMQFFQKLKFVKITKQACPNKCNNCSKYIVGWAISYSFLQSQNSCKADAWLDYAPETCYCLVICD